VIASFFEHKQNFNKAGDFYWLCNDFERALLCYVKSQNYEKAVQKVHKLKSEDLFDFLVCLFAGESEELKSNNVADPIYLFQLFVLFEKY